MIEDSLRDELLAAIPKRRALAISFTGHQGRADDLVQDTITRAWANIHKFEPGTNLNAWLFTIFRNLFHSDYQKRKHEIEDASGSYAARLKSHPNQYGHLDFKDFHAALATLPVDQREAMLLVGAHGMSYEETAEVCRVAVGTFKSRVNRAQTRLAVLLDLTSAGELGPDDVTKAALTSG
jgi:RNA polymerase sigma-70 factor (ECF subfamily)